MNRNRTNAHGAAKLAGVLILSATVSAFAAGAALAGDSDDLAGGDHGSPQSAQNIFDRPNGDGHPPHPNPGGHPGGNPGGHPGGDGHPVQPVPEPGTMALAGMGLMAMAGAFKNRFRR